MLDASVTMSWCYPDEDSDYADRVLDLREQVTPVVPSLWAVEVANAVLVGKRRQRLTSSDVSEFLELLNGLEVETDPETAGRALHDVLVIAREHGLTGYDATYLELAMRRGLTIATVDKKLRIAAKSTGVEVFEPR